MPADTLEVAAHKNSDAASSLHGNEVAPARILVHDYAGHPFQVQLSRSLAARGHEVLHAFAGGLQTPRGELVRRENDAPSFDLFEVPMNANYAKYKYSFLKRRRMEIEYGKEAGRLIEKWRPDVVLSANTPTEAQSSLLKATKAVGGRFGYWVQDFYSIAVDKIVRQKLPVVGGWIGNYYRHLDRKQFSSSDHIVVITEDFAPLLTDDFGVDNEKIVVAPNWAPIESLPVLEKQNDWAKKQGLEDKFVFLYTGTLGMKHNPNLLLAIAEEFKSDDRVRVVVVSEGIGIEWLREQAAARGITNLVLLPFQPFSELPQVLATGDVLLSVLEEDAGVFSVPSKVLTYLCAKRALLLAVPEVNLAARIIVDQQAGLTVQPSDSQGFVASAKRLYSDDDLREQSATNARNYAESTFSIGPITDKFENVLCASK